jgi:hypothetical protein
MYQQLLMLALCDMKIYLGLRVISVNPIDGFRED